ncbi:MAG: hypothetical protein ACI9C3_002421 [Yoonia sp.]|jgi:hypothetical protein
MRCLPKIPVIFAPPCHRIAQVCWAARRLGGKLKAQFAIYKTRISCGGPPREWWRSGLLYWVERVDDNQFAAAAWARDCECSELVIGAPGEVVIALICTWGFDTEQLPDLGDIGRAVAIFEEPVVADAVLASWEYVDQEPVNELNRCQRHGGVAARPFGAVILDPEGDMICIGPD